jgi:hypothetical protein
MSKNLGTQRAFPFYLSMAVLAGGQIRPIGVFLIPKNTVLFCSISAVLGSQRPMLC